MTKLFVFVFLCMFTYGAFAYMWGPALIALFCACFMLWADRSLEKRRQEWLADPRNAHEILSSIDMLQAKECECSACTSSCPRTKFHGQTSKPDSYL